MHLIISIVRLYYFYIASLTDYYYEYMYIIRSLIIIIIYIITHLKIIELLQLFISLALDASYNKYC